MSNPAVFRLNKLKIRDNTISIEDNIGESIHFHLGLVRFDLSVLEFDHITKTLLSILNARLNVRGFDLCEQDAYFLERIAPYIPYVTAIEDAVVNVDEILCLYEEEIDRVVQVGITNSPIYKYYLGNRDAVLDYEIKRDIWVSKEDAMDYVVENRNHLIYLDERNRILDGHKSLCIGLIKGEIDQKVKVKKIICENEDLRSVLQKERREW